MQSQPVHVSACRPFLPDLGRHLFKKYVAKSQETAYNAL